MANFIFSGSILIQVQGLKALRLQKRHYDCAEYTVLGFDDQVIIYDFRVEGLKAIDEVLNSHKTSDFPKAINKPAHLTMYDLTDDEPMIIELRETNQPVTHLLWIAIGLEQDIPIYEYDAGLVQWIDDERVALLMLLDIDHNGIQLPTHVSSSSSSSRSSTISRPSSSSILFGTS